MGLEKFNAFEEKNQAITSPVIVQLELTDSCNYRCIHCYNKEAVDTGLGKNDLSNEQILGIVTQLIKDGVFFMVFTGGEPLVRKELLIQCVNLCYDNQIITAVNTNLALITEDLAIALRDKIRSLLVSCPSSDPDQYREITGGGSYQKFEEKLRLTVNLNVNVTINMVISKKNLGNIRSTASAMAACGVKRFGATPMVFGCQTIRDKHSILNNEELELLVNELLWVQDNLGLQVDMFEAIPKCAFSPEILQKRLPFLKQNCNAGRSSVIISNCGNVRPCPDSSDIYGNVLTHTLPEIYARMAPWRNGSYLPEECKKCAIADNCFGACRVQALNYSGGKDRTAKDPWMKAAFAEDPMERESLKQTPKSPESVQPVFHAEDRIFFQRQYFYWRAEPARTSYLLFNGTNFQMQSVNKELFQFFQSLYAREDQSLTIGELAKAYKVDYADPLFQGVIWALVSVGFIRRYDHLDK